MLKILLYGSTWERKILVEFKPGVSLDIGG